MSTTAAPTGRGTGKAASHKESSFWKMELGKKGAGSADDDVEHPPFVPTLPRVDLLPASVRQSFALRRVRRWLLLVVVLLVAAVVGVWYLQAARIADAEAALAQAQSEGAELQGQMDALGPVKAFYTELEGQQALVTSTLASQPLTALVIQRLTESGQQAGEAPVTFSTMEVFYLGIPAPRSPLNGCPNPDPFGTEITIGCVTFNAQAESRADVSRLLEAMEADPLFVGPYVTSTSLTAGDTGTGSQVTFTGTTGVSPEALETPLTPEQVEAIVNPPAATAPAEGDEAQ